MAFTDEFYKVNRKRITKLSLETHCHHKPKNNIPMYKGIPVTFSKMQTMEGHEGTVIRCVVKYQGKQIANYYDDGNGGMPDVNPIGSIDRKPNGDYEPSTKLKQNRQLLLKLEEEFKKLPKVKIDTGTGSTFEVNDNLDFAVSHFIEQKEMLKLAKKGLLIEKDGKMYISTLYGASSIANLFKKTGNPPSAIKLIVAAIQKQQLQGYKILMQDYYISLGIDPKVFK